MVRTFALVVSFIAALEACSGRGQLTASDTSGNPGDTSTTRPAVARVTVTPATPTLQTGATVQLNATTADASGATLSGRTVTWATNNSGVATVSQTGLVSALSPGSASISA